MRNRGERRFNTMSKIKNWAKRFYDEGRYYSMAEALRIAKRGGRMPRSVWDPDHWSRY